MNQLAEVKPIKQEAQNGFSLVPTTLEQAKEYAQLIASSEMVPKDYQGKPANCLVAMQMGMELGIAPMQSLQNIAVINGRPAVWGDLLPALAQAHPEFEYINEQFDENTMTAICMIKRKNQPEQTRTFSKEDAATAGLWGKNTWKSYPKRMLQMRARGFAVRDVFPDALKGISVAEDIIDLEPKDYSTVSNVAANASSLNEKLTENQVLTITAYIDDNELDSEKWLNYFEKHFKSRNIADIPANMFDKTMSNLKAAVQHRRDLEAETGASE